MRLLLVLSLSLLPGCPRPLVSTEPPVVTSTTVHTINTTPNPKGFVLAKLTPGKVTTEDTPHGPVHILHAMRVKAKGVPPKARVVFGGSGADGVGSLGLMILSRIPVLLGLNEQGEVALACSDKELYVLADREVILPDIGRYMIEQDEEEFQEIVVLIFDHAALTKIKNAKLVQFQACEVSITLDQIQLPALKTYLKKALRSVLKVQTL